jgi:hypothetical protein
MMLAKMKIPAELLLYIFGIAIRLRLQLSKPYDTRLGQQPPMENSRKRNDGYWSELNGHEVWSLKAAHFLPELYNLC